ncbi:MAG: Zn-dependent oxidoreductase [Aminivibrio sp.]|jgi:L-gulonate 5-dehydrogenase
MKVVYVEKPRSIMIREAPIPHPGVGEVLLRVRAGGICGSDMQIYHGTNPQAKYPRVIGHEFCGDVAEVGESVAGFSLGDHVAVDPVTSCGFCYPCSIGRHNVCSNMEVFGVHKDGGFAEYVVVGEKNLHKIPSGWPFEKGALVEPFTIAANILSRTECTSSDRVLVLGAGPIGQVILQGVRRTGAVCAVADIVDERLEKALSMGADIAVNTRKTDLEGAMMEWTGGSGVPLIIDAAGASDLFPPMLRMASPAGRIGLLSFSAASSDFVQLETVKKELSIFGSRLNCSKFPEVISWFEEGSVKPESLVTHRFPFEQTEEALKFMEENPAPIGKVMLEF